MQSYRYPSQHDRRGDMKICLIYVYLNRAFEKIINFSFRGFDQIRIVHHYQITIHSSQQLISQRLRLVNREF